MTGKRTFLHDLIGQFFMKKNRIKICREIVCPNCEQKTKCEVFKKKKEIEIRGEKIYINIVLTRCLKCKNEFDTIENEMDELDLAYREYRKKHNMLQPDEIMCLRKSYYLTPMQLDKHFGFTRGTIKRYEHGALQELRHDTLLQSLKNPFNLLRLNTIYKERK